MKPGSQGPVGSRMPSWCTVRVTRTSPVSYVWGCRPRQRGLTQGLASRLIRLTPTWSATDGGDLDSHDH